MYSCPFCAEPHEPSVRNCPRFPQYKIPYDFIRSTMRRPALSLMTVGRTQVGKTWFVAALSLALDNANLEGMACEPMDDFTFEAVRRLRERVVQEGSSLPRTRIHAAQRPLLLQITGLPDPEPRCVAVYDVPGEIFDTFDAASGLNRVIRQVTTAWMLVDLQDFQEKGSQRRLTDLFLTYRQTLQTHEVDFRDWHLIVVFTKADKYQHRLPRPVVDYVLGDELRELFQDGAGSSRKVHRIDHDKYLARMREISELLRKFTIEEVDGGRQFEIQVRNAGMKLAFTAISASGQDPDADGFMAEMLSPCRILDPLLWAFHYESVVRTRPLLLLVDDGRGGRRLQADAILEAIRGRLAQSYALSSGFLGSDRSLRSAVQKPPAGRGSRPALLGPVLESLPAGCQVVVLAASPIADLADFADSPWRDSLLIVRPPGTPSCGEWPHQLFFTEGDSPEKVKDALRQLGDY